VRLSVVIPTLDEERFVAAAVASVREAADEVLVVDGGSSDRTRTVAAATGACVIESPRGRGVQLHRGARETTGDWLVFLHADTRLDSGWRRAVETLAPEIVGGAFRFALDTTCPARRYSEWAVALRSRLLSLPFGDQSIFCRRSAYERAGGFPGEPLFEDVAFFRALRRIGPTALVPVRALSSPRRMQRDGPVLTTLRNNALLALFLAGVAPTRLARFYRAEPASAKLPSSLRSTAP
jgi:rSAM/selenodomain-associated transferase 2